jgi:hypothetical protein
MAEHRDLASRSETMLQVELGRVGVLAAAVGFFAVALTACQGGLSLTDAPERSIRTESRRAAAPGPRKPEERELARVETEDSGERPQERRAPARNGGDAGGDGDAAAGGEEGVDTSRDSAVQSAAGEPSAPDLEFTADLPEPPQQSVAPAARTWAPPPDAEESAKPVIEDVWPDKGPASGGERVVIRGRNLKPAQVVFGLAPARIVGVSEAQDALTVEAPAGSAGPAAVVVTNADGNYALSGGTFEYYR